MSASANSPNALWAKHGFTIERQQRRAGGPKVRTIRSPAGDAVLHDAGYDAEMDWINDNLESHHH